MAFNRYLHRKVIAFSNVIFLVYYHIQFWHLNTDNLTLGIVYTAFDASITCMPLPSYISTSIFTSCNIVQDGWVDRDKGYRAYYFHPGDSIKNLPSWLHVIRACYSVSRVRNTVSEIVLTDSWCSSPVSSVSEVKWYIYHQCFVFHAWALHKRWSIVFWKLQNVL